MSPEQIQRISNHARAFKWTSERDTLALIASIEALAEQGRRMREALELAKLQLDYDADALGIPNDRPADKETSQALALTPAEAEAKAKRNAEHAALLMALLNEKPMHPGRIAATTHIDWALEKHGYVRYFDPGTETLKLAKIEEIKATREAQ